MSEHAENGLLTEKEAAKRFNLSLTDFRLAADRGDVGGEIYIPYDNLPDEQKPRPVVRGGETSRAAYVRMYRESELTLYGEKPKPKKQRRKKDSDEWPDIIDG